MQVRFKQFAIVTTKKEVLTFCEFIALRSLEKMIVEKTNYVMAIKIDIPASKIIDISIFYYCYPLNTNIVEIEIAIYKQNVSSAKQHQKWEDCLLKL